MFIQSPDRLITNLQKRLNLRPVDACRVLIISGYPLFAEGLTRLLAGEAVEVIAAVEGWEQARALIAQHRPQAIIVDAVQHEAAQPPPLEPPPLPTGGVETPRVIYLSLAGNEMVVHERRRVTHVTVADLLGALRASLVSGQAGAPLVGKAGKAKKRKRSN